MGNEIVNFSKSYNLWASYRAIVKNAKQIKQARNKSPIPNGRIGQRKVQIQNNNKHKFPSQTQIIKQKTVKELNQGKDHKPTQTVSKEQIKKKMPSVITGSKIAPPLSQQIIKGDFDVTNLPDNSPLLKNTQTIKMKVQSAKDFGNGVEAILVKDANRHGAKQKTVRFASKIDMTETLKTEVKQTRQRIDILANGQEREYVWMLSQLQNQRVSGLTDRNKALFLIKQAQQYQRLIISLRTKRQIIVKILNQLNQQRINEDMQGVITEINKYIDSVQKQFIRIDWRAIIAQTAVNMERYVDMINAASSDQNVLKKLSQMENKQSLGSKHKVEQIQNIKQQSQTIKYKSNKQPSKQVNKANNRMSHEIIIDSIQKMIAGQPEPAQNNIQKANFKKPDSGFKSNQNFQLIVTSPSQVHTTPIHKPSSTNNNNHFPKQSLKNQIK